jgi:beta-mannosidase
MSFGWDFAPPIRTMGIWDDAQLVVTGGVFIEDVCVNSQLSSYGAGEKPEKTGFYTTTLAQAARLMLQVTLDSDQPRSVQAVVRVQPANFAGADFHPAPFDLDLPAGRSAHALVFDLPDPQPWEPWDRGFPHLYELIVSVSTRPSQNLAKVSEPSQGLTTSNLQPLTSNLPTLDSVSTRFGIRHIALDGWTLVVNGRREFIRGANWVPADSLPGRLRRADYAHLLGMARAAGVNLLRVWGGGLREKRAFYDLCDELGLLVWQEFPFACAFLGHFPRDASWLALVERECTAIVQATRNHPSLALWCGGNEFSPRRNHGLVQTLERVVAANDGARPFVPASPSPGDAHNWSVWHAKYPLHAYRQETACFLSEFGLQAPPSLETLRACLPISELWPPGTGWKLHHAELSKLWRYAGLALTPGPSPGKGEGPGVRVKSRYSSPPRSGRRRWGCKSPSSTCAAAKGRRAESVCGSSMSRGRPSRGPLWTTTAVLSWLTSG